MYSASLSSKEQAIIACADVSEERPLLADCADELSIAVKDKHFAVGTKDEHKACQLRDDALLDVLFDVNTFL